MRDSREDRPSPFSLRLQTVFGVVPVCKYKRTKSALSEGAGDSICQKAAGVRRGPFRERTWHGVQTRRSVSGGARKTSVVRKIGAKPKYLGKGQG